MSVGFCVGVRASFGRGRFSRTAAALAGVAFCCAPAQAQEAVPDIKQRVESVFAIVPQNSLELAVPLSRRALSRRAAVEEQTPTLSYGTIVTAGAASAVLDRSVAAPSEASQAVVPPAPAEPAAMPDALADQAAAPGLSADSTRMPRARPEAPLAFGTPLDLVAGAALAEEEQGSSDPQELLLPPPDESVAAIVQPPTQAAPPPPPVVALAEPVAPAPQAATAPAAPVAPANGCLAPSQVTDADGDFARNAAALTGAGLCITETKFKERRRPWDIQLVSSGRPGPLWAVMHDDEDVAFDNAVHALKTHGGKLIAVETGGKRNQDGIDPNRNFSGEGIGCSKIGNSATPKFTAAFTQELDPAQPIVALHNNHDGPVPTGGLGHLSMKTVPKDMRKSPAGDPEGPLAGERALVLLASGEAADSKVESRIASLNGRGINVVLETVRKGNGDCSLSNYAVLSGHPDYLNVTVDHDEGEKQRKIVDVIMSSSFTVSAAR